MKVQYHRISGTSYQTIWDFQTLLNNEIKQAKRWQSQNVYSDKANPYFLNHLVFCEHKPVYTIGKSGTQDNLLSGLDELQRESIELFKINRGGDITYHGPGQLTAYFIFDLEQLYRDVHRFVRDLEECVIRVLNSYDLKAFRMKDYTGVWLGDEQEGYRKICAIGVHLSRWVSMHGLAFNISTDLDYFDKIIPCGIDEKDKTVSTLSKELGYEPDFDLLVAKMIKAVEEVFNLDIINP